METGMRKFVLVSLTSVVIGLIACASMKAAAPDSIVSSAALPTTAPAIDLTTGWRLLQEGQAQGTIEQNATHPTNSSPHILRIAETKAADPGEGRVGAVSDIYFPVEEGAWYDVTFSAVTEAASIGLVFSLENADGKVLARTTLPEIGGRGRRRGGATTAPATTGPAAWKKYLVALHARDSDSSAHVTITPIEPTNIWIDGLTLTPRPEAK
jgi:hypothetical protein